MSALPLPLTVWNEVARCLNGHELRLVAQCNRAYLRMVRHFRHACQMCQRTPLRLAVLPQQQLQQQHPLGAACGGCGKLLCHSCIQGTCQQCHQFVSCGCVELLCCDDCGKQSEYCDNCAISKLSTCATCERKICNPCSTNEHFTCLHCSTVGCYHCIDDSRQYCQQCHSFICPDCRVPGENTFCACEVRYDSSCKQCVRANVLRELRRVA